MAHFRRPWLPVQPTRTAIPEMTHRATSEKGLQRLLTLEESARLLGIGRTKIYELVGRGELPVVKIDRSSRIRPSDLEEFVEAHVTRKAPPVARTLSEGTRNGRIAKKKGS